MHSYLRSHSGPDPDPDPDHTENLGPRFQLGWNRTQIWFRLLAKFGFGPNETSNQSTHFRFNLLWPAAVKNHQKNASFCLCHRPFSLVSIEGGHFVGSAYFPIWWPIHAMIYVDYEPTNAKKVQENPMKFGKKWSQNEMPKIYLGRTLWARTFIRIINHLFKCCVHCGWCGCDGCLIGWLAN